MASCAGSDADDDGTTVEGGDVRRIDFGTPPTDGYIPPDQDPGGRVDAARQPDGSVDPDAGPDSDGARRDAAEPVDLGPLPDLGPVDPDDRPDRLVAGVVLTRQPQGESGTATAAITEPVEVPAVEGCTVLEVDPNAPAPPIRGYHGGRLTVEGTGGGPLTFAPAGNVESGFDYVPDRGVDDGVFAPGAELTLTGEGGPHFEAFVMMIQAPDDVDMSRPSAFGDDQDVGEPLQVRWRPAESDTMLLTVFPVAPFSTDPEAGNWIFCAVAETGAFDVPPEFLGQIGGGGIAGRPVIVALTRTVVHAVPVGDGDQAVLSALVMQGGVVTLTR